MKKKIASKLCGMTIKSIKPRFKYQFKEADTPLEIPEEHANKILYNSNFYEFGKLVKKDKKTTQKDQKSSKGDS